MKQSSEMLQILIAILKTARPRQWIKNLSMFAALVFSGFFFEWPLLSKGILAFVVFCVITSTVYIFNDLIDAPQDRLHPFKKKRPIASGALPVPLAVFLVIVGFFSGALLSYNLSPFFFFMGFAYTMLHVIYTLQIKKIPILDVFSIAAGFIIRVYAGALVVNLHMSVWFLLTVISLALFLAVGKRQSERTLLTNDSGDLLGHRQTLSHYTPRLLDIYTGMFSNATWLSYAIFTFNYHPVKPSGWLLSLYTAFPKTFNSEKLLMITIPVVIYGIMRYLQLVYEQNKGESPERVLLSDKPLLVTMAVYAALVWVVIYWLI